MFRIAMVPSLSSKPSTNCFPGCAISSPTASTTAPACTRPSPNARQSGGTVRIRSKPGAGTEVDIYVPRALGVTKPEQPQAAGDVGEATVRRGTVLIVDDQEEVREIAAIHLEALGYEIIQAANGRAALDLLEVGGAPAMDVLLVDYAMPGISGAEVIRAARQARPNLPAVLMTGYADADP